MIFNNYLTEQQIVEKLIETSGMEDGVILITNYNEETDSLLVYELSYIKENAPDIQAKDLYITKNKNNKRHILVGGSNGGGHGPRMKISEKGSTGNSNTITLRFDSDGMKIIGNIKDINMDKKEFKKYVEFAERNINLIKLAAKEDLDKVNKAILKDAKLYNDKIPYERTKEGKLIIYDKDDPTKIIRIEDLNGKKVKND